MRLEIILKEVIPNLKPLSQYKIYNEYIKAENTKNTSTQTLQVEIICFYLFENKYFD